ncbi:gamma-glutamylcyclotransferase family protein [Herbiconiux liangxiaofengii]|uniref:gamma-glutamylcyclotransferase family protein n=1 Tax=Herbiconiux liangxiaofengii TaxID=3342795 RepID=UPI0035BAD1E8
MTTDATLLFSYGTLRQPELQLAVFGRLLDGRDASVVGYAQGWLAISDPAVIAASGSDRHPLLIADPDAPPVAGTVFEVTPSDLIAADAYEVDDYERVLLPLDSGEQAWVYVFAGTRA